MWNKVLTTAEIAEDYAGKTPSKEFLIHHFKLNGDYTDYGLVGATATNSGSTPQIIEDRVAAVIKASYVGDKDKFLIFKGVGGQLGTASIAGS